MTALERQMAADAVALSKEHADRADAAEARWAALREYLNDEIIKVNALSTADAPESSRLALACTVAACRMVLMKMRELGDSPVPAAGEGE